MKKLGNSGTVKLRTAIYEKIASVEGKTNLKLNKKIYCGLVSKYMGNCINH